MNKKILASLAALAITGAIVYAQSTGTPSTLRVRTDANNYLLVEAAAQTLPISQPTVFSNTRLRTDSSNNLQVVLTGGLPPSSYPLLIPASTCASPNLALSTDTDTGIAFTATPSILNCINGSIITTVNSSGLNLASAASLSWSTDLFHFREGANHSIQRNSTTAQRFSIANTYTSATNNELFSVDWQTSANTVLVGTRTGSGGGTSRPLLLLTQNNSPSQTAVGVYLNRITAPHIRLGFTDTSATFGSTTTTTLEWIELANSVSTATSGTVMPVTIRPTYNQTASTAANTDLLINRTQTSVGSGLQYFTDWQVGGSSRAFLTNQGQLTLGYASDARVTDFQGLTVQNTTASTMGVTLQYSPAIRITGTGWDIDNALSRTMSWIFRAETTSSNSPSSDLIWYNGDGTALSGMTERIRFTNGGNLQLNIANFFQWAGGSRIRGQSGNGLIDIVDNSQNFGIQINTGTAAPTVTTCGTGAVTTGSRNTTGQITATGATACTVTFGAPNWTNTPFCTVTLNNIPVTNPYISATSVSAFTVSGLTANDVFTYHCIGRI